MPRFDAEHYLPVESYTKALEAFHAVSGIILFEFARQGRSKRDVITKLEPAPEFPDQRSALSNTLLVGTMIIQEGLNASTLAWRALVYD